MPKPLVIRNLECRFQDTSVFTNVNLQVEPGELIAVLGASGCGKTTLLRCIAGLMTPQGGDISIGGELVASGGRILIPIEQRGIGLVFQDYALFPYLDVRENVGFGLSQPDTNRVNSLLELTGIQELDKRRPNELSGGQQQRVALARALAPNPHLLLLDEPFANVDTSRRTKIGQNLVATLAKEERAGLFVTHDQNDAMAHATRIAVFTKSDGASTIAQCDTPETLYRRPSTKAVAELLGPVNLFRGEASGTTANSPWGTLALGQPYEGHTQILFRPDALSFCLDTNGSAVVSSKIYLGSHYRLTCSDKGCEFSIDVTGDAPEIGARGTIKFPVPGWALPT